MLPLVCNIVAYKTYFDLEVESPNYMPKNLRAPTSMALNPFPIPFFDKPATQQYFPENNQGPESRNLLHLCRHSLYIEHSIFSKNPLRIPPLPYGEARHQGTAVLTGTTVDTS